MNKSWYKCCAVPMCKSTSISTPQKLFINVPKNAEVRKKWLTLARRDPASLTPTSTSHFCEDHFDVSKDMNFRYLFVICQKLDVYYLSLLGYYGEFKYLIPNTNFSFKMTWKIMFNILQWVKYLE